MKASVLVISYNSGPILEQCIESVLDQGLGDYEVVLVDNRSTDDSFEHVMERFGADPKLRLVRNDRNQGCAGGRNRAISEARGEILCFIDSDAVADPGWLRGVLAAFENHAMGVVASRQVFGHNPIVLNGLGGDLNFQGYGFDLAFGEPIDYASLPSRALFASGNGLCTRRTVVEEIGVFDDVYFNYYEDVDFCLRARRAGYDVGVAPQATIHHHLSYNKPALGDQRLHLTERNRIRTVLKHFPLGRLLRWMPNEWQHERKMCRDHKLPRGTFRHAWAWNLKHLGSVLRFRATHNGNGFDLGARLRPSWGHAPFKSYNMALRPSRSQWTEHVLLGRGDEAQLLFGWYEPEETPDGVAFRWTDDLAGLALLTERSVRGVEVTYCFADDDTETFVHLLHPESGRAFEGKLPKVPPFTWTSVELEANLPEGVLQLVLQTPKPYREPHIGGRFLGVATHRCRALFAARRSSPAGAHGGRAQELEK
ncbi:MAG: glycosyltransferase family 2 protein [Vicinamibacteria bacterium]